MIQQSLRIRYATTAQRDACAWFISGGDPQEWLEELLAWKIALAAVRLYIVPRWRDDLSPRGVLAVPAGDCRPSVTARSQAYGRAAQRVYLPTEATLDPDLSDQELASILGPAGNVYLLHPSVGLVGFEPGDCLRVSDLIQPPVQHRADWDHAEPGTGVFMRLISLEPDRRPSLDEMLEEGRDDIAREPPSLDALPPSPAEPPQGLLYSLGQAGRRVLANFVRQLAEGSGDRGKAGSGTGQRKTSGGQRGRASGGLARWARAQLSRLDTALAASRNRELLRLMHLLNSNPDEGLRYALPCMNHTPPGMAPRDQAPSSGRLSPREIDFNLARLGGGGPVNPWVTEYFSQLRVKYLELANRELRLRRHRRAAYIYAELLGDLSMAAATLASGRFWREAAVLYRERLNQPNQAAQCLEQGGLWSEAIALNHELKRYEHAGDLHVRIGQHEEARQAFRLAISQHLAQRDSLAAAKLLESKLQSPEEALEVLEAAWPTSAQAKRCLEQHLLLLARLGRHDAARKRVETLRTMPLSQDRALLLVEALADGVKSYPDNSVGVLLADAARTVAADRLRNAPREYADKMLCAIRRLEPADLLLSRDCDRFRSQCPNPPGLQPRLGRIETGRAIAARRLNYIPIRRALRWQCAAANATAAYIVGCSGSKICLVRAGWDGTLQFLDAPSWRPPASGEAILLLALESPSPRVILQGTRGGRFPYQRLPETDRLWRIDQVGSPGWLPSNTAGLAADSQGNVWAAIPEEDLLRLQACTPFGEPIASQSILYSSVDVERGDLATPIPLAVRGEDLYVGVASYLVALKPNRPAKIVKMPGTIRSLQAAAPYSRSRIAVGLSDCALVYWDDFEGQCQSLLQDVVNPSVGFLQDGSLIAISGHKCFVYGTDGYKIHLVATTDEPVDIVTFLSAESPREFALLTVDGSLRIYELPDARR